MKVVARLNNTKVTSAVSDLPAEVQRLFKKYKIGNAIYEDLKIDLNSIKLKADIVNFTPDLYKSYKDSLIIAYTGDNLAESRYGSLVIVDGSNRWKDAVRYDDFVAVMLPSEDWWIRCFATKKNRRDELVKEFRSPKIVTNNDKAYALEGKNILTILKSCGVPFKACVIDVSEAGSTEDLIQKREDSRDGATIRRGKEFRKEFRKFFDSWKMEIDKSGYIIEKSKYKNLLKKIKNEAGEYKKVLVDGTNKVVEYGLRAKEVEPKKLPDFFKAVAGCAGRLNNIARYIDLNTADSALLKQAIAEFNEDCQEVEKYFNK